MYQIIKWDNENEDGSYVEEMNEVVGLYVRTLEVYGEYESVGDAYIAWFELEEEDEEGGYSLISPDGERLQTL